jgi:hypothetical protein
MDIRPREIQKRAIVNISTNENAVIKSKIYFVFLRKNWQHENRQQQKKYLLHLTQL